MSDRVRIRDVPCYAKRWSCWPARDWTSQISYEAVASVVRELKMCLKLEELARVIQPRINRIHGVTLCCNVSLIQHSNHVSDGTKTARNYFELTIHRISRRRGHSLTSVVIEAVFILA